MAGHRTPNISGNQKSLDQHDDVTQNEGQHVTAHPTKTILAGVVMRAKFVAVSCFRDTLKHSLDAPQNVKCVIHRNRAGYALEYAAAPCARARDPPPAQMRCSLLGTRGRRIANAEQRGAGRTGEPVA